MGGAAVVSRSDKRGCCCLLPPSPRFALIRANGGAFSAVCFVAAFSFPARFLAVGRGAQMCLLLQRRRRVVVVVRFRVFLLSETGASSCTRVAFRVVRVSLAITGSGGVFLEISCRECAATSAEELMFFRCFVATSYCSTREQSLYIRCSFLRLREMSRGALRVHVWYLRPPTAPP